MSADMRAIERVNRAMLTALGWVYVEPPDGDSGGVVIAARGGHRIGVTQYPGLPTTTVHVRIDGAPEGPRGDVLRGDVRVELLPEYLAAVTRLLGAPARSDT